MGGSRDFIQDFTLRTLSIVVVTTLVLCVLFLAYRWWRPSEASTLVVPTVPKAAPREATPAAAPAAGRAAEVLKNPGHVYRCEDAGKVTYSDSPCPAAPGNR